MKKIIYLTLILLLCTGCRNNINSQTLESTIESTSIQQETEEETTEEILYSVSLESEINKMQNIIFTTALAATEYSENYNIYNEELIWKSVYYYLNYNYEYNINEYSIENVSKIFSGFYGLESIYDCTVLKDNLINLNKEKLSYEFKKLNNIEHTYYISDYKFNKTDIELVISLYDVNEEHSGTFKFILDKNNKITNIDDINYKYKIKSFEKIKTEDNQ
jgi:hypothetical protein